MEDKKPVVLSAHPINAGVRARVMAALADIERERGVKVLFACESGSRGWGFASPDSDYDVRFVYVQPLSWHVAVEDHRDVIELPIDSELDVSGWELRKALRLMRSSNPTLLEWLDSPVVYREAAHAMAQLRALAPAHFLPERVRYHYLAMAKKNFRGHLQGATVRLKKYLYVLRPLLAVRWIDEGRGMPPMRFADLAAGVLDDAGLLAEINALLEIKMRAGEAETSPPWPGINAFIEAELARAVHCPHYKKAHGDAQALSRFLLETVLAYTE